MKPIIPIKYMLALGLFVLATSFIVKFEYPSEPDAIDGLLKGFSIGVLALCVIYNFRQRRAVEAE